MKKFEIIPKGSLSQYIKDNTIKAKNEISNLLIFGPGIGDKSCFDESVSVSPKGLSVSL